MVLRAVLSAQADKVSQALGTRSGVEMRAARAAAERIGAQIVLGEHSNGVKRNMKAIRYCTLQSGAIEAVVTFVR